MGLQTYPRALASFLLILVTASIAQQTDSAIKQFQKLRFELRKSRQQPVALESGERK
jgi:hypothetical protein